MADFAAPFLVFIVGNSACACGKKRKLLWEYFQILLVDAFIYKRVCVVTDVCVNAKI